MRRAAGPEGRGPSEPFGPLSDRSVLSRREDGSTIDDYTDQAGNPVSRDRMFRMVSESMLANVIAFEAAGVPVSEIKQAVGRDGGTVIGRGVVFRVPIERRLSQQDAELLLKSYGELLGGYNTGRVGRDRLDNIRMRSHSVGSNSTAPTEHLQKITVDKNSLT